MSATYFSREAEQLFRGRAPSMIGLFITGTDTGVGKTFVTCWLARRLLTEGVRVGTYKPVCSGAEWIEHVGRWRWHDVERLAAALDHQFPDEMICPQRFRAPLAPPVAARLEATSVNSEQMLTGIRAWEGHAEILLIEGVGGWKCPLTDSETVADLARKFGFPVLLVSPQRLGTISHTLLSVEAIEQSRLPVVGILMNQVQEIEDGTAESNMEEINRFTPVPILGTLPFQNPVPPTSPRQEFPGNRGSIEIPPSQLRLTSTLASMEWRRLIERANQKLDRREE